MCVFHRRSIKFVNKSKKVFVDDYLKNYSKRFQLRDRITIEINDEFIADFQNFDCNDKYSPMQSLTKKKAKAFGINVENDIVFIPTNYYEPSHPLESYFSNEELYALLSHEIGHVIASYTNHDCGGTEEELYADDCACNLGFKDAMLSVVKKMLEHYDKSPERQFDCLNDSNKEQRKLFEKRISVLSNP